MGKIKDAIKESFSRKAPEPAPKPKSKADPPPADPAVESTKVADAKARFLKLSEKFMTGGCTRAELDAAREAAGG